MGSPDRDTNTRRSAPTLTDTAGAWSQLHGFLSDAPPPSIAAVIASSRHCESLRQVVTAWARTAGIEMEILVASHPDAVAGLGAALHEPRVTRAGLVWVEVTSKEIDETPSRRWADAIVGLFEQLERGWGELVGRLQANVIVAGPPAVMRVMRDRAPSIWRFRSETIIVDGKGRSRGATEADLEEGDAAKPERPTPEPKPRPRTPPRAPARRPASPDTTELQRLEVLTDQAGQAIDVGDLKMASRILGEVARDLVQDAANAPATAVAHAQKGLKRLAQAWEDQRNLEQAVKVRRVVVRLAELRAERRPDSVGCQRELLVALNYLADTEWGAKEFEAAAAAYQRAVDVAWRLLEANPSRKPAQIDLLTTLVKLGDVFIASADHLRARDTFEAAATLLRASRTSGEPPDAERIRIGVMVSSKLGDSSRRIGNLREAQAAYAERADWERDLTQLLRRGRT
jgi:tetratricopeptide (TPR) repeat protein